MKKFIVLLVSIFIPVCFANAILISNPIGSTSFTALFTLIADWIIDIALVLAPLVIVYGGFLHITAAGSPEKSKQGKKVILYAAIGLIVALLAKSAIGIIEGLVVI